MIDRAEARRIARELVSPADADWNRIALFGATGAIEDGTAEAVRETAEDALRRGLPDAEEVLELAEYLERRDGAVPPGGPVGHSEEDEA